MAVTSAMELVEGLASVSMAGSVLLSPVKGATCDVSFIEEKSDKATAGSAPNHGTLNRTLMVAAIIKAQVPLDMSAAAFEDLLGRAEAAMAKNQALAPLANDWFLAGTEWHYSQEQAAQEVAAALKWQIDLTTATADPGSAL